MKKIGYINLERSQVRLLYEVCAFTAVYSTREVGCIRFFTYLDKISQLFLFRILFRAYFTGQT